MNEKEFIEFINKYCFELRWDNDILLGWVNTDILYEFIEILNYEYSDDGGYPAWIQSDCICLELNDLCEYHLVNPESILKKEVGF